MNQKDQPQDFEQLALLAVLAAALRTGLLAALTEGPTTESQLSKRLALNPRALDLMLDYLHTVEWVHKDGEQVQPGSHLLALGQLPGGYLFTLGLWGHAEAFLRTGEPFVVMDSRVVEREAAYRNIVSGLATIFEESARDLAARLPVQPKTILEIGCGSGVWSLAIAERDPHAQVTGLDLPAVLDNFKARAKALGLEGRTHTLPGDMHEVEIPRGAFDLVVIANVLRLETPERAERVVRRAAEGVAQNGRLLIVDSIAEGTSQRERARTLYALHLGLRTQSGQVHRRDVISGWLTRAGFSQVTAIEAGDGTSPLGGLLATKADL